MMRALTIGILSAAALAACASTPSHAPTRTASAVPPGWCSSAAGKALRPGSSGCDAMTRTYSGRQLRDTGTTNVARALQMLDPSITAVGH
jgi:hypothetical protein